MLNMIFVDCELITILLLLLYTLMLIDDVNDNVEPV